MLTEVLRLTSAGSVDDGKSTILARLLLDTGSVLEDQLGGVDIQNINATTLADLLDGLESERAQGITIDVAHRFFDSEGRRYHIADSPGHEQYTRNMVTAASHADAILLVVDVRAGLKPQTRLHCEIARMLGVSQVVVAVNKMDLVGFTQKAFREREKEIREVLDTEIHDFKIIPVSGLMGENVVRESKKMAWWQGGTLLGILDRFQPRGVSSEEPLFSVQLVQRVSAGGRRYLGSLVGGCLKLGDTLYTPKYSSREIKVTKIVDRAQHVQQANGPSEISIEIDSELDLERGDVFSPSKALRMSNSFEGDLVWLDENDGLPGRSYLLRVDHQTVTCTVTRAFGLDSVRQKTGVQNQLSVNEIARVNVAIDANIVVQPSAESPNFGCFVLIDHHTGRTVAAGVVNHSLRRAENVIEHSFDVSVADRSMLTGQSGRVVWFTGLSGSGKSTLANAVSVELKNRGVAHSVLDGDSLRMGINKDLGFSEADRVENIRRTAEVAKLMADSGLIVLVSLISPFQADRERAREIVGSHRFTEVFLDTPLDVCEQRDPKGLYAKARQGLIPNFTGVGAPYEAPPNPDIVVNHLLPLEEAANEVISGSEHSDSLRNLDEN